MTKGRALPTGAQPRSFWIRKPSLRSFDMPLFNYDDRVRVIHGASSHLRPGSDAWVVGIFEERPLGAYFADFPDGVIYTIDFDDGQAADVHEGQLEAKL